MTDEYRAIACADVEVRSASTREYELAAAATARITGPAGGLWIERRYEALPRHNDVVDPGAADSNDELVDRPDAIHVHTEFYALEGDREEYFLDAHETWTPEDLSPLEGLAPFLAACREHHVGSLGRAYAWAMADRRRNEKGP